GVGLAQVEEFVPGGDDGNHRAALDADLRLADRRQDADLGRVQLRARLQDQVAPLHVFTRVTQVGAGSSSFEDADLAASLGELAERPACRLVCLLEGHDGVGTPRYRGAGHDTDGPTGLDLPVEDVTRGYFADD